MVRKRVARSAAARTPSDVVQIHCSLPPANRSPAAKPACAGYGRRGHRGPAPTHRSVAGVLPDDRVVYGPAGVSIPHQRRLSLVRDSSATCLSTTGCRIERDISNRCRALPDLDGLCCDPSARGRICSCSSCRVTHLGAVAVEDHAAGAVVPGRSKRRTAANCSPPADRCPYGLRGNSRLEAVTRSNRPMCGVDGIEGSERVDRRDHAPTSSGQLGKAREP